MKTITLETLAEKLNGNLWTKGELKRVYIERGYNTKKMGTKTYIYEKDGKFLVSCYIDCPSQPFQWIKSQQNEIIESVSKDIENIINQLNVELIDYKLSETNGDADVLVKKIGETPLWLSDEEFHDEFGAYPADVFNGELQEKQLAIYQKLRNEKI